MCLGEVFHTVRCEDTHYIQSKNLYHIFVCRPTFVYFTWYTCLSGLIGCIIMCFLISAVYSSISLFIMLVLAILLHFRSHPSSWGSISQALIFHQVCLICWDKIALKVSLLQPRQVHYCFLVCSNINDIHMATCMTG